MSENMEPGYRRSRVGPTTNSPLPAAGTATGTASDRSNPSNSVAKKRESTSLLRKILKFFFVLMNVFAVLGGVGLVVAGVLLQYSVRDTPIKAVEFFGSLPVLIIVQGVFYLIFGIFGITIAFADKPGLAIAYLVMLIFLMAFNIFTFAKSTAVSDTVTEKLDRYWGQLTDQSRAKIQNWGRCCGLQAVDDRAALPCPDGSKISCGQLITSEMAGMKSKGVGALVSSLMFNLFLAASVIILAFTGRKTQASNKTEEL